MVERRRATRPEPIEVELANGEVLSAQPLAWPRRNDLGNEVLSQYIESTNLSIQAFTNTEGTPQLEAWLDDKFKNPEKILELGYPDIDSEMVRLLDWPDILELIYATLEVNGLENLRNLIDPNSPTPTNNGGIDLSGENQVQETQKTQSMPDSDSPDSQERMPLDSPITSSLPSLQKENEPSGTKDTGS